MTLSSLKIKIFADIQNPLGVAELLKKPYISGFTTNPTLARKGGVTDYEKFGRDLASLTALPVSFEVLSDNPIDIGAQAIKISSWGPNVYAKVPITNSHGHSSLALIAYLMDRGVKVNVTAITTVKQVEKLAGAVNHETPFIASVFAGRIADAGYDAWVSAVNCCGVLRSFKNAEVLWASTREISNIIEAQCAGCHIITVPPDILAKAERTLGGDLEQVSLETVRMFVSDAAAAGFSL